MDALSRGLRTRSPDAFTEEPSEGRMRATALSMAREVGVELTEDKRGVLDV